MGNPVVTSAARNFRLEDMIAKLPGLAESRLVIPLRLAGPVPMLYSLFRENHA
jgi:hypothetical protein